VVVLDALEEQVARLLEEGVDGQVERIVVGEEGRERRVGVLLQGREVGREVELLLGCLRGQLVEKRCEEMRVADCDGKLDQNILVPEHALLEAALVSIDASTQHNTNLPFSGELALLVGCHECGGQTVCAQVQGALRAPAHVVDEGNCPLVELVLVVELVLDGVEVDEVAHARARVPAHVVGVHVHFPEELNHLVPVCDVLFGTGSASGEVGGLVVLVVVVAVTGVDVRNSGLGEGERVRDFKHAVLLHAH
jgi:hypothetical protein